MPSVEEQVWATLVDHAQRNRQRAGEQTLLSKITEIVDHYNPERETHNFDNVVFDAQAGRLTPFLLTGLAWAVSGKPFQINQRIVKPFEPQIDEICEARERGRLMVLTGHQTIFEPAFALLGIQKAISKHTGESYADIARDTSVFVARAMAPVDIVLARLRWPLTSLGRQLADVYYTLPRTKNYADLPEDFLKQLNTRTLIEFAKRGRQLAAMSASATEEKKNEHGEYVINRITGDEKKGTMGVLLRRWHIIVVGGDYKRDLSVEPGKLIPAGEATPDLLHDEMQNVVVGSRLRHGIPAVYESEAEVKG